MSENVKRSARQYTSDYKIEAVKLVEAIIYLIFIANNIMQLFLIRRLRSRYQTQKEMGRLLLKGL